MDQKFKKNFLKGSATTTLGTGISMIFHFVSIMILTREIPKQDFGIYALILVIANLLNILGSLGLDITLVKYISSEDNKEKSYVLLPVLLMESGGLLIFASFFYLVQGFILPLFDAELSNFALLIAILFIISGLRDLFYKLLQGLNYFRVYASVQIFSAIIRLLSIVLLVLNKDLTLLTLIYIEIGVTFFTFIAQVSFTPLKRILSHKQPKEIYRELLNFSFPIYLNNIFTFMYGRVNLFIIGGLLSPVSVALYDVAAKVPEALKKMFNSFIVVYFPNISNLFSKDDKDNAQLLMNKSLVSLGVGISAIVLIAFLFKEEIVLLLFSERYLDSAWAFAFLVLNFNLRAFANILGYSVLSAGYPKVPMKVNVISSTISVSGSFILIPVIGFIGTVYSLILMNTMAQLLYTLYLNKAGVKAKSFGYLKPLLISAIILLAFFFSDLESIYIKICALLLFGFLNWLFIEEFKSIFNILFRMVPKFNK